MMDVFTPEKRSAIMSSVKSRNTSPEITVRRLLHRIGFRFRLHRKDLPGKPDIVLLKYNTTIFVHGCFWHGHHCKKGSRPMTNASFWNDKIDQNKVRDERNYEQLMNAGWNVVTIWECQTKDEEALIAELLQIAGGDE